MARFFRFPAYRAPLARNALISVVLAAAAALPWPFLTIAAALAATLYLTWYGFTVIERAAEGFLYPDDYPAALQRPHPLRPLKMFAILVAAFFCVGVVSALTEGGVLTTLALIAVALLLPASVMTLAMTDRLRQAINPLRLLRLARQIGPSYLVLFACLLLLMVGSTQAFELVAPLLGDSAWLLALASSLVGNYFFLIMCALMGYVLYQYSEALDLVVIGPGEARTASAALTRREVEQRRRDARLGRLVARGRIAEAIALLDAALADQPGDLALHARLHKLLWFDPASGRIDAHTERYLGLLLADSREQAALALAAEALARNPAWRPRQAEQRALLAQAAQRAGNADLAQRLTGVSPGA